MVDFGRILRGGRCAGDDARAHRRRLREQHAVHAGDGGHVLRVAQRHQQHGDHRMRHARRTDERQRPERVPLRHAIRGKRR